MTRAFWIIPLAAAGFIASSTPAAVTMRIEALGYFPLATIVEITTSSFAEEHKRAKLRPDSVVGLPMSMEIGDSIQRIHVVASGFGSIQVTLINPEAGDSLVSVGRDITLTRKLNEPFRRIWTVQPLLP